MNDIKQLIFTIRDKQIMLDSDVARLYKYEVRAINQTVKRNINRFPEEFCFQLSEEEYDEVLKQKETNLLINSSQIVMSSTYKHRGTTYRPYVFSEQGIAMLSGLLKNDIAVNVSINIMNAFVDMRKFISSNKNLFERVITIENNINSKFLGYDKKFDELFDLLQTGKEFKQHIFFNGQIYDAYSLLVDIISQAQHEIIIIDNYVDKTILDLLSKKNKNVDVHIITNSNGILSKLDISKFNEQYPKLKITYSNDYHDRFIIIDNDIIYHCGASLKDLGKKIFGINKIEDKTLLNKIFVSH